MTLIASRALVLLTALLVALGGAAGTARADDSNGVHYYLSLGDSLAAGEQLPSPENFGDEGYADQLYALEKAKIPNLQLVKLGCLGESTASMITAVPTITVPGIGPIPYEGRGDHFFCSFPHGSQLAEAASFLHAHRGFVSFVTIDIGGNDVISPTGGGATAIEANLPLILSALRDAAGPDVPIVGMNYYSPTLPFVWFDTHDLRAVQDRIARLVAFNDLLESTYAAAGDRVADVESAFSSTDTTLVGGIPLDVLRLCEWTWECTAGILHPNTTGYAVIAQTFAGVIP